MKVKESVLVKSFIKNRTYGGVAREVGLSGSSVRERLNRLGIESEFSAKYGKKSVKLVRSPKGSGRIVSLAHGFIKDIGFKPEDVLVGKWSYEGKGKVLRLEISKR